MTHHRVPIPGGFHPALNSPSPNPITIPYPMKTLTISLLAFTTLILCTNCETTNYEANSTPRARATTTTTTEETTLRSPYSRLPGSTTVETQTTQAY